MEIHSRGDHRHVHGRSSPRHAAPRFTDAPFRVSGGNDGAARADRSARGDGVPHGEHRVLATDRRRMDAWLRPVSRVLCCIPSTLRSVRNMSWSGRALVLIGAVAAAFLFWQMSYLPCVAGAGVHAAGGGGCCSHGSLCAFCSLPGTRTLAPRLHSGWSRRSSTRLL